MIAPWPGIVLVLAVLAAMTALLKAIEVTLRPPAELTRKLLHVGMGLVVLSFPWVFHDLWPVLLLSAVAAAGLLVTKLVPKLRDGVGTVVTGVRRTTLGEVYFPVAVGVTFYVSGGDKILYCVPMLIMALADTVAALIGVAYGRVRYVTSEGLKSAEGSIAFFAIAFLSVHVPLLLFTDTGRAETLLIAVIIGVLAMLLEAIAWRGLDNLLIPLGALFFLKLYLGKSADDLLYRLGVTAGLLIFVLAWRKRAMLDDSALIGAALFGYGAWMLGGPLWLVGPVLLFLTLVTFWPRGGPAREHSVFAALSVLATALIWLTLYVRDGDASHFCGYALTFGVHLAIFGVSRVPLRARPAGQWQALAAWVVLGSALTGLQIALFAATSHRPIDWPLTAAATLLGVAAGATAFFVLRPRLYTDNPSDAAIHWSGFACGLGGTLVAAALRHAAGG